MTRYRPDNNKSLSNINRALKHSKYKRYSILYVYKCGLLCLIIAKFHVRKIHLTGKVVYIGVAHVYICVYCSFCLACIYRSHSIRYLLALIGCLQRCHIFIKFTRVCRPTTTTTTKMKNFNFLNKLFLLCPDSLVAVLRSSSHTVTFSICSSRQKQNYNENLDDLQIKLCFCFHEKPITSVIVLSLEFLCYCILICIFFF